VLFGEIKGVVNCENHVKCTDTVWVKCGGTCTYR